MYTYLNQIFEDRFLFEEGVYWAYTTDEKRNIAQKDIQMTSSRSRISRIRSCILELPR